MGDWRDILFCTFTLLFEERKREYLKIILIYSIVIKIVITEVIS